MPGNISTLGLGGSQPTKSIVNTYSSGGVQSGATSVAANATVGSREVLSGALTANTLATVLTVSTAGQIPLLSIYSKDATSRTLRLQITADGTVVFDATSSATSAANAGMIAAGTYNGSFFVPAGPIRFNNSLVVKVASSLTETDKVAIAYILT